MDKTRKIFLGKRLTFWVMNRYEAADFGPDEPYIVISIRDPDVPETPLRWSPKRRAALHLQFHDRNTRRPGKETTLLSEADARAILGFVRDHLSSVHVVVCHCDGGLGRSPAVAAALSRIVQDEDAFFFENFVPNEHVYRMILAVQAETDVL
jgi:predicted protein tyrosine phosphatase